MLHSSIYIENLNELNEVNHTIFVCFVLFAFTGSRTAVARLGGNICVCAMAVVQLTLAWEKVEKDSLLRNTMCSLEGPSRQDKTGNIKRT